MKTVAISTAVGFCPHCMSVRNMRAIQTKREKRAGMDREISLTHHCETCGFFVENETVRTPSWDELIYDPAAIVSKLWNY